ncbi:WSC domain-containing protein 1 [Folsomia candida]|uniref:WSC domain-containing protein 1 n=1 Tax=Folsomia candida TaxID=158441 RepID=A0A226D2R7_FOLCA|nr:WSC domain-containing protein 1 [Folsomia candida]
MALSVYESLFENHQKVHTIVQVADCSDLTQVFRLEYRASDQTYLINSALGAGSQQWTADIHLHPNSTTPPVSIADNPTFPPSTNPTNVFISGNAKFSRTSRQKSHTESISTRHESSRHNQFFNDTGDPINTCVRLHFRQGVEATSALVVGLVSVPGSGNTWLRYLLQLSTGVTDGRVIVVKTHESNTTARAQFQKAILLIRTPAEAIVADFNRYIAGHLGHAGMEPYTRNRGRYWSSFVSWNADSWLQTNLNWIQGFQDHLFITTYHQLYIIDLRLLVLKTII